MKISLSWSDLLKLGANGRVETEEFTLELEGPVRPQLLTIKDEQAVAFTLDTSDPGSTERADTSVLTLTGPLADRIEALLSKEGDGPK